MKVFQNPVAECAATFVIFSVMMVFQLLFVLAVMPETKGKTLEERETKRVFNE